MHTSNIARFLAAAALLGSPLSALASGNNLTMVGATFDTTGQKFGTAALASGYGVTPAGTCWPSTTSWGGTARDVWFKAPTALPSSFQLIMGDPGLLVGESPSGYLVIGSGQSYVTGASQSFGISVVNGLDSSGNPINGPGIQVANLGGPINDGLWHHIELDLIAPGPSQDAEIEVFTDTYTFNFQHIGYSSLNKTTVDTTDPAIDFHIPSLGATAFAAFQRYQTGIGGGPFTMANGSPVATFAGEIDEASCWAGNLHAGYPTFRSVAPFITALPDATNSQAALGLWHLDGNGLDSSTQAGPVANYAPAPVQQLPSGLGLPFQP